MDLGRPLGEEFRAGKREARLAFPCPHSETATAGDHLEVLLRMCCGGVFASMLMKRRRGSDKERILRVLEMPVMIRCLMRTFEFEAVHCAFDNSDDRDDF